MNTKLIISALAAIVMVGSNSQAHTPPETGVSKTVATQMAMRDLWVDHIFWVRSVAVAAADKNKKAQSEADKQVVANAQEIAAFLSGANPHLPKETLVSLLAGHGGHHITQINQLQKHDFSGEAETWGAMKQHMYMIADALVGGIAKQFPDKF